MTKEAEDLEGEALKLSPSDRAWLAERLLASLDEASVYSQKEIEAAWIEESNQRFEAYRNGKMTGQPAQDAITELLAERD
jgi:putative addiction module component (TIGR02574 family)